MTSGRSTLFGSRRVAVRDGRRPAGRRAWGLARRFVVRPLWVAAVASALFAGLLSVWACEDARRGIGLIAAVDSLHPGSRIAVEESSEEGLRTVEVTITSREMAGDVAELDRAARRVARTVRDQAGLQRGLDTVVVVYRSEESRGFLSGTRRARFVYRVAELEVPAGAE